MYNLIFDFLETHLFNGSLSDVSYTIGGQAMNMNEWLSHTFTIVSLALMFVVGVLMIRWVFRLVGGLFVGIGR